MRIVLIGISILLSLQCCLAVGQVRSNNDGKELETVQKYIQKLGLDARWGEYLENELATERKAQRRKEIADLLAYEYGEMLFRLEETGAIVKKSENLLQIYPGLEAPILRVAILHSRYRDEQKKVETAWQKGGLFQGFSIQPLNRLSDKLKSSTDRIQKRENQLRIALEIDPQDKTASRLYQSFSSALVYAQYLKGWLGFYQAVCDPANRAKRLVESDTAFREFFEIEPELPVSSIKRSRFRGTDWEQFALLGWASVKKLQARNTESKHLFDLSEAFGNKLKIRRAKLKAAGFAFDFDALSKLLDQSLSDSQNASPIQMAEIALQLSIRSNIDHLAKTSNSESLERLREEVALKAKSFLLCQEQAGVLSRFRNSPVVDSSSSTCYELWSEGLIAFSKSKNDPAQLELAYRSLDVAVQDLGKLSAYEVIHLRFLFGKVLLQQGKFEHSVREFAQARQLLNDLEFPELAAEILWWNALSSKRIPGEFSLQNALESLTTLIEDYPNSRFTKLAQFEKLKLKSRKLPAAEAYRQFSRFQGDRELSALVQIESLRCLYRMALNEENKKDSSEVVLDFQNGVEALYRDSSIDAGIRIRALLMRVEFSLRGEEDDRDDRTGRDIQIAMKLATELGPEHPLHAEVLYFQFRLEEQRNLVDNRALELARQLVEKTGVSKNRKQAGLIFIINALEERPSIELTPGERILRVKSLVDLLGQTEADLRSNKNAKTAMLKLGRAYLASKQWQNAESVFAKLLNVFPSQANIILGLAQSKMGQKEYGDAIRLWRRLVRGAKPGSPIWLEAKLGVIQVNLALDPVAAKKILEQTRQMAGKLPEVVRKQMDQLESKILEKLAQQRRP